MFRFTYNTLVYGHEPIEQGIERIARYGYDGVEFIGEPQNFDVPKIQAALQQHGVQASSIVSIYTPERDVVSSDPHIREAAAAYIRGNIDFAHAIGAELVTFTPTACMKISPEVDLETEWGWAVATARASAQYAAQFGIRMAVEPWNRYETYLINTAEQANRFVDEVAEPNIGVMVDTFHMSIEEANIAQAIESIGPRLAHVHLADSNRAAPGQGHLDFDPIMKAIVDTGYQGWISYELLPAAGDVWGVLSGGDAPEFLDPYTESSIAHTKEILARLGVKDG